MTVDASIRTIADPVEYITGINARLPLKLSITTAPAQMIRNAASLKR
jgi:hypothetical protein